METQEETHSFDLAFKLHTSHSDQLSLHHLQYIFTFNREEWTKNAKFK